MRESVGTAILSNSLFRQNNRNGREMRNPTSDFKPQSGTPERAFRSVLFRSSPCGEKVARRYEATAPLLSLI